MPAGNNANLIPLNERSPEEAYEIRRKGGLASAAAKAKRKTLKEQLLCILDDENIQALITTCLVERAKQMDNVGNKAYEIIRDTVGEKEPETIKFENSPADELLNSIDEMKNKQNED